MSTEASTLDRAEQRQVLRTFGRSVGREAHHLRHWPEATWQLIYGNWLQFADRPMPTVLDAERVRRDRPAGQLWARRIRPPPASESLLAVLEGHSSKVNFCAWRSDGAVLVTASSDKTARLWDGRTGAPIAVLEGHTSVVTACAFSPDGAVLATTSSDGTARLWDGRSGTPIAVLDDHTWIVQACAFSPDGAVLATTSYDTTARLWDGRTGAPLAVLEGHAGWVEACAFSPDGALLATASYDGTARLWGRPGGNSLGAIVVEGYGMSLAFHPAAPRLAVGAASDVLLCELVGLHLGPLIVAAIDVGDGEVVRCPACQSVFPVETGWLGREIACPQQDCEARLRVNSFVVKRVTAGRSRRAWWRFWERA